MKLSVLDQSPVSAGFTPADALQNTIELARLTDKLGYERYWVAEHHAMDTLAGSAPEVLLARLGAETSGIRIGSGAVLLPHYSPLKVAESFRLLHALYPNRIDLGIGRAPGGSSLEAYALRRERNDLPQEDDFSNRLAELLNFLNRSFVSKHPYSRIKVSPDMPGGPVVWLLGSSMWSAAASADLGLPYAFAHFINPEPTSGAIKHYQTHFRASAERKTPEAICALGVVCADTEAEAQRLFASTRLLLRRIRQGQTGPIPRPEDALRELGPGIDPFVISGGSAPRYAVGTPEQVRSELTRLAGEWGIEEMMLVTAIHDHAARLRSYELLAEAFQLQPRSGAERELAYVK